MSSASSSNDFVDIFHDLTISRSQHVEPAHLVLEAEVVSGRAAEVLRAPRLHLRSPQGHFKYLKRFPLKLIKSRFSFCLSFKETKLLFDELNFCLQRLYSIPFHVEMPFNDSILEEITTAEARYVVVVDVVVVDIVGGDIVVGDPSPELPWRESLLESK